LEPLIAHVQSNLINGIELIQIREKDLSTRQLADLTTRVLDMDNPHGTRVLVNSRIDVAITCGAHGVHLPSNSPSPNRLREICPTGFLFGVSCHSLEEIDQAQQEGADFVVFGPVFLTASKIEATPIGLEGLKKAAKIASIPVFALGGVTTRTADLCIKAGATGVAGISMFQKPQPTR